MIRAYTGGDVSSDNDLSSTKAAPVKHGKLSIHSADQSSTHSTYFAVKSTKKSNLLSEDNASEDVILVSPGTLAKQKNVLDELFPIDEDARQSKKSHQVIPMSPQSRPSPASDSSTTARTSNLQPPPRQSYSLYPPPSAPWPSVAPPNHHPDGIPGAHPSAHGYLGYCHHYPPPRHRPLTAPKGTPIIIPQIRQFSHLMVRVPLPNMDLGVSIQRGGCPATNICTPNVTPTFLTNTHMLNAALVPFCMVMRDTIILAPTTIPPTIATPTVIPWEPIHHCLPCMHLVSVWGQTSHQRGRTLIPPRMQISQDRRGWITRTGVLKRVDEMEEPR